MFRGVLYRRDRIRLSMLSKIANIAWLFRRVIDNIGDIAPYPRDNIGDSGQEHLSSVIDAAAQSKPGQFCEG